MPDQFGQPWCFAIKVNNKQHYFAAESEQDRINWMVEIIKLRGVPKIISLLDGSRLARHAAFALANLSGKTDGSIQEDIVKHGGVQQLLKFMSSNKPDERLADVIYYAMTKLAQRGLQQLVYCLLMPVKMQISGRCPNTFLCYLACC